MTINSSCSSEFNFENGTRLPIRFAIVVSIMAIQLEVFTVVQGFLLLVLIKLEASGFVGASADGVDQVFGRNRAPRSPKVFS